MQELSEKEKLAIYQQAMSITDTEDANLVRSVSCSFFREGGCPKVFSSECKGCLDEEAVFSCRDHYLSKIYDKPATKWTPEFDRPRPKEKTKLKDISSSIGMQCDTCYMNQTCPVFQTGAECSIDWDEGLDEESKDKEILTKLIDIQRNRIARMQTFEKVDGGMVDMNLSSEIDRLSSLLKDRVDIDSVKLQISMNARGPANSSNDNSSGSGLLAKLFGTNSNNEEKSLPEGKEQAKVPTFDQEAEIVTNDAEDKKDKRKSQGS